MGRKLCVLFVTAHRADHQIKLIAFRKARAWFTRQRRFVILWFERLVNASWRVEIPKDSSQWSERAEIIKFHIFISNTVSACLSDNQQFKLVSLLGSASCLLSLHFLIFALSRKLKYCVFLLSIPLKEWSKKISRGIKLKEKKVFNFNERIELKEIFILENENQFVHVFHNTVSVQCSEEISSLHVFSWPVQAQIVMLRRD